MLHFNVIHNAEINVFIDRFLRVLQYYESRQSISALSSHLQWLWGLSLSHLRRINHQLSQDQHNYDSEMCMTSQRLQSSSDGAITDPHIVLHATVKRMNPGWWGLMWLVHEALGALHTFCFQIYHYPEQSQRCLNILSALKTSLDLIQYYIIELTDNSTSALVKHKISFWNMITNRYITQLYNWMNKSWRMLSWKLE